MKDLAFTSIRYAAAGLLLTAISYVLFITSIYLGFHYLVAMTIASGCTVIIAFFLHRTLTFASPWPPTFLEVTSFLSVFGVQYFMGVAGYTLLMGFLGLGPSLAFVLNAGAGTVVAFCLNRYVTFRRVRR